VTVGGEIVLKKSMPLLRDLWEATSFALEKRQCELGCVTQEREGLLVR
jgi:hypothetical protein